LLRRSSLRETIGFIGLGALGLPLATNLLERECPLRLFNRTASKAAPLVARGAQLMTGAAGVATAGGVVISVPWDDASVEALVASPGFLESLEPGGVHVSMSTISPDAAKRVAALHAGPAARTWRPRSSAGPRRRPRGSGGCRWPARRPRRSG
jgi:3-hydroxyisobutyrate dehydrogenase-like beta-hydroxyacid dehydrogenase